MSVCVKEVQALGTVVLCFEQHTKRSRSEQVAHLLPPCKHTEGNAQFSMTRATVTCWSVFFGTIRGDRLLTWLRRHFQAVHGLVQQALRQVLGPRHAAILAATVSMHDRGCLRLFGV